MTFEYVVRAELDDPELAARFRRWLVEGHMAEVCRAGAVSAELVLVDAPVPTFEARYVFPSREAFAAYERDHAPRLRAESAAMFGAGRFTRSTGERVHQSTQRS